MKSPSVLFIVSGALLLASLSATNRHPPAGGAATDEVPAHTRATVSYGETVFRLQNLVMDDLINAQMTDPSLLAADRVKFAGFESRLVDTCSSLNEAAGTIATRGDPGMVLKLRVMVSMAGCERSALAAKAFMASDHPLLGASLP